MTNIIENTTDLPYQDKVDFIYSYNKTSPLFIRKAGNELEKKNLDDAIKILSKGIKNFPNYAASYLLLGKIYVLKGEYRMAIENIKKGSDLIHSRKTYGYYINEIEDIKNKIIVKEAPEEVEKEVPFEKEAASEKEEKLESKPLPIDEKLGDLVKEVSPEIKSSPLNEKSEQAKSTGKNIIISETLAKIFISQGEYKEAIDTYNLLKEKHPEKTDYYIKKIEELKTKLD